MKFFDYSEGITDGTNVFAGISRFPQISEIIAYGTLTTTISHSEMYRADRVADRLWGDPELAWVLDILNGFETGINEYELNREIMYVSYDSLRRLGIA